MLTVRFGFVSASLLLAGGTFGQKTFGLEAAVAKARREPIVPRVEPPAWMQYDRVQAGYGLMKPFGKTIVQVLGTSSLAATFAAQDVAPVLMQTGRLPHDFTARMKETEARMFTILFPPKDRESFTKRVYGQSYALGEMHVEVAKGVNDLLRWDPHVRVPMNGQAYAFVLYSFAYWPVEALIAQKALDPVANAKLIDDWFHLWSVVGYGMGVPESLLPRDYARAQVIVALLRRAQYASSKERLPDGIPVLLGAHVRMMAERSKKPAGEAAATLATLIAFSPGLAEALGIGEAPAAKLAQYSTTPEKR